MIVSDVGNNEFWVSRAYEYSGICNRILYSKSFGTLGCAIGKAIGACYYTQRPVLYGHPEFEFIARAYNIPYYTWSDFEKKLVEEEIREWTGPGMIELEVDMEVDLQPGLPLGNTCQNLEPALPEEQYAFLDQL